MEKSLKNKVITMFLVVVTCCTLTSCNQSAKKNDAYGVNEDVFVGTYYPEGYMNYIYGTGKNLDSKMSIMYDGEKYNIELWFAKHGKISCVGNRKNNYLIYTGATDSGLAVYGRMESKGRDIVGFELWDQNYLSHGDKRDFLEMYFYKSPDIDEFVKKISGYWVAKFTENMSCDILQVYGDYVQSSSYFGEQYNPGRVINVEKNNDFYEITVFYKQESEIPAYKNVVKLRSDDDFRETLIVVDDEFGVEYTYYYAGDTYDECAKKCDEIGGVRFY